MADQLHHLGQLPVSYTHLDVYKRQAMESIIGPGQTNVVIITLAIIIALFLIQHVGTAKIGRAFGPIMTLWFLFLGGTGLFFVLGLSLIHISRTRRPGPHQGSRRTVRTIRPVRERGRRNRGEAHDGRHRRGLPRGEGDGTVRRPRDRGAGLHLSLIHI